jgi:RNA polymerase sigma factor (sigma-70 family)
MEDLQLLREYAEHRSEQAFAELVNRHVNLVYSAALRVAHEPQLAEDVTQLVFIKLARKAGSLRHGTVLTGWLYRTTRFIAETVRRSDWRRRKRENLAMQLAELNENSESVWKDVAPLLEQAMAQLRQADQDAVLLRFFAGKSLREIGDTLGISDDAAQKRINRALDRMRDYFARDGVVVSASALAPALIGHAVQAAPVSFASSLATSVASASATGVGVATFNVLKVMTIAKLKTHAVGVLVAAILLFSGGVVLFKVRPRLVKQPATATSTNQPAALVLRGTVRAPDGKPLAGALVRVATPQAYVRLYQTTNSVPPTNNTAAVSNITSGASNRIAQAPRQAPSTNTAADGSFVIALPELPKEGLAAVVVHSDAGYALVTAEELLANPDVTVQSWARIEGVLRVGKSLAGNETVSIGIWGSTELYDWNLVQHGASTKTDANGQFVFPRVAPIDVWLTRTVMVRTNDGRQSGHRYLKVLPGDQLVVQLGGVGRALTGRVLWDSTNTLVSYGSMWASPARGIRHPRDWKDMPREEQRKYERAWRDSPEGELFKDSVRNYEFPVQADGTFRVDDVLPGSYRLNVRADEPVPGGKGMRHAAVAEIRVDVPEMFAGESDEPIDVGTLVPRPASNR